MDEKTPSIWKQYGPALAMAGCCLAPALIAAGISLAARAGLGAGTTSLVGVAIGGAGVYLWKRQRAGASASGGASGMACCPAPEASAEKASLEALAKETDVGRLTVGIGGMHCASCVAKVEQALQGVAGVVKASVSPETETATVEVRPGLDPAVLAEAIRRAGYEPRLEQPLAAGPATAGRQERPR